MAFGRFQHDNGILTAIGRRVPQYNGVNARCFFLSADCTGTCYVTASDNDTDNVMPISGSIYRTGTGYVRGTGTETDVGATTFSSYRNYSACVSDPGNFPKSHAYAVTTAYSLPAGVAIPLSIPLTVQLTE
jgi:hypothetical protein